MLFINTRPADRACTLSQALRQQAWSVIELPLLELQACPWSDALAQLYQQLLQAQRIVVVSPTAVHIGMEYLAQSGIHLDQLQHLQWIAVGEKRRRYWQNTEFRAPCRRLKPRKACWNCLY